MDRSERRARRSSTVSVRGESSTNARPSRRPRTRARLDSTVADGAHAKARLLRPDGTRETRSRPRLLTLPEQIAQQLAQDIVNQALAPGHRLKETELSQQFGASRAPIREALRLLEQRGLVQIEPRHGVRVTDLSASEVDDLYEIRASLLGLAARRVALRRDERFLTTARNYVQQLKEHASDSTGGQYFEVTYKLSNLIAATAGSPKLFALISSFSQQVARYTRLSLQPLQRRKQSSQIWERLLRALESKQPELAEETQRMLVFGSRDKLRELLEAQAAKQAA